MKQGKIIETVYSAEVRWRVFRRCFLPLAAFAGCVSCGVANRQSDAKREGDMFVARIAEIEVHPEWLEAYLAAAGTVGAESVAKEPDVACIFKKRLLQRGTDE